MTLNLLEAFSSFAVYLSTFLMSFLSKVAQIVVKQQRPDSRLDDDAKRAAEVWNEVLKNGSESDDSEDEVIILFLKIKIFIICI